MTLSSASSRRQYYRAFGAAMAAYLLCLVLSIWLLRHPGVSGAWRVAAALLPMLPVVAMCLAVLRQLRRMDELQRRIQLEALSLAFAGTAVFTLGWGFLELAGLRPLPAFAVWPVMAVLWIAGLALARRRYA